jgi:hypothetical protein
MMSDSEYVHHIRGLLEEVCTAYLEFFEADESRDMARIKAAWKHGDKLLAQARSAITPKLDKLVVEHLYAATGEFGALLLEGLMKPMHYAGARQRYAALQRCWVRLIDLDELVGGETHDPTPKARRRRSKVGELLLSVLEDDQSRLSLSKSELAELIERDRSSVTRAFASAEYGPRLAKLYTDAKIVPPSVKDV